LPIILAPGKAEIRRIEVRGQPGKKFVRRPPISKIITVKWTGGVVQVAECKCEALNSNPNSIQKKLKTKKMKMVMGK
jgi:hypothetical protein